MDCFFAYSKSKKFLTLNEFRVFLDKEQGTKWKDTDDALAEHAKLFLHDAKRDVNELCFTISEV